MAFYVGYVERNSQSGFKGVILLFVSIKPRFKHKRRQLGDQIAALGRTTRFSFFFLFLFADTLHKWLSVCPACNWGLWISYSIYILRIHFQPFSAFKGVFSGSSLCHSAGGIIFSVSSPRNLQSRMSPTHGTFCSQGGVRHFSHSA